MSEIRKKRPKVTIYITSRNYGRFLAEAVESVLSQTLGDWELIIVDDGSTDDTKAIAKKFESDDQDRIRVLSNKETQGLRKCANLALQMARGEYFMRLDADDYLDESALYVLAGYLDGHPDIALVYPNWTYISEDGSHLGTEYRKKIGSEVNVLDLPPHGACTMVRRRVLRSIGGYDTNHDAQDGHELWMKVASRYKVGNIATPLFFYRQHEKSMSRDNRLLLSSRREIKRSIVSSNGGSVKPNSVAVIPVKNSYEHLPNVALNPVAGKPLIDYTIEAAEAVDDLTTIYVYTDDPEVAKYCSKYPDVICDIRAPEMSSERVKLSEVLSAAVDQLEMNHKVYPDIVALLSVHTPLRTREYIREAIDTLLLYEVDSVISTYEDLDLHFIHGKNGMRPLNPGMINKIRYERETIYVGNGAIHVTWRDAVIRESLFKGRVGHIVMPRHHSYYIKSPQDIAVVSAILTGEKEQVQEQG